MGQGNPGAMFLTGKIANVLETTIRFYEVILYPEFFERRDGKGFKAVSALHAFRLEKDVVRLFRDLNYGEIIDKNLVGIHSQNFATKTKLVGGTYTKRPFS